MLAVAACGLLPGAALVGDFHPHAAAVALGHGRVNGRLVHKIGCGGWRS